MKPENYNIASFKCPNCGASAVFKPGIMSVFCEYCQNTFALIMEQKNDSQKPSIPCSANKQTKTSTNESEVLDLRESEIVHCKNCSSGYLNQDYKNSSNCMVCGSEITDEDIHTGFYVAPSHYLPFEVTKTEFMDILEDFLKENNFPSLSQSPDKFSELNINRLYIPFWTDDMDIYTDDQELENPYFSYRNLFIIASGYIESSVNSEKLMPWDRNRLMPVEGLNLQEDEKILLFSFPSRISGNSEKLVIHKRKKQLSSLLSDHDKKASKIKKASLVLLPVHTCHFMYREKDYYIYQNGYNGKIILGYPSAELPSIVGGCTPIMSLIFILILLIFLLQALL